MPRVGVKLLKSLTFLLVGMILSFQLPAASSIASATDEYRVKTAFIYNFLAFTQWPEHTGKTINLCIFGKDYFGDEIDLLQTKSVNQFAIKVSRLAALEKAGNCQALFISKSEDGHLSGILDSLQGRAILTLTDSTDAASKGAIINMHLIENKVKFEINLESARHVGLIISARLLQLATRVYQ
ncbi:YfiR family protein [Nitrosomonas sp.]|uniref:YfiR family protein n=1 Tax=Nitrosomonas sp. TaxID=42353 RepID=UPI0020879001|nr:YfiR family protein [Nitrosomonas sp.]GJL76724.1 MAG: hypothetical protein NMNS02_28300 [Nitrosomonas sp.]